MTSLRHFLDEHHPEASAATPISAVAETLGGFIDIFDVDDIDIVYVSILMIVQSVRAHPRFELAIGQPRSTVDVVVVESGEGLGVLALSRLPGRAARDSVLGPPVMSAAFELPQPYLPENAPWVRRLQRPTSPAWASISPSEFISALEEISRNISLPMLEVSRPTWRPLAWASPPAPVDAQNQLLGSVGVEGLYGNTTVYTTAEHCIAGAASVSIDGRPTHTLHSVPELDFAVLDGTSVSVPTHALTGVRLEAPGLRNRMEFNGVQNGIGDTHITGVDPAVTTTVSFATHIYTDPNQASGDSGCALIDADDRLVGFCHEETDAMSDFHATSWVWADQALRVGGVVLP